MNDILQQIMNMIENTRTVPSISSFSMIGFTVLLIFGVINSGISASAFLDDALWLCHWSWNWIWCSVYRWCDREIYVCGFYGWSGCTTGRDRICEL